MFWWYFFQIFQIYLHVVAIAFLCYLQFYLLRHHDNEDHHANEPQSPFDLVATLHRNEDGLVTLSNKNEAKPTFYFGESNNRALESSRQQSEAKIGSQAEEEETTWIDLSTIGGIFDHEGSSLFLRFGTLSMHFWMEHIN